MPFRAEKHPQKGEAGRARVGFGPDCLVEALTLFCADLHTNGPMNGRLLTLSALAGLSLLLAGCRCDSSEGPAAAASAQALRAIGPDGAPCNTARALRDDSGALIGSCCISEGRLGKYVRSPLMRKQVLCSSARRKPADD
jgi:hypothetical protein